jgi:hypothetical protein
MQGTLVEDIVENYSYILGSLSLQIPAISESRVSQPYPASCSSADITTVLSRRRIECQRHTTDDENIALCLFPSSLFCLCSVLHTDQRASLSCYDKIFFEARSVSVSDESLTSDLLTSVLQYEIGFYS